MFAMGGGGSGGSVSGASSHGISGAIDHSGLLAFVLPHGHQNFFDAKSNGLLGAQIPGLLNLGKPLVPNHLFGSGNGQFWADLKQRLNGPATTGSPPIEGMPIQGLEISGTSNISHGLGGVGLGGSAEIGI